MRRRPLQNRVPLFEPVQLRRHARPEAFGIRARFGRATFPIQLRFDVGVLGKLGRRRKNPILALQRFNVCGGC